MYGAFFAVTVRCNVHINTMSLNMAGDKTGSDGENLDTTDTTDRSLITDISDTLSYLSPKSRKSREKDRLRKELVREHIENQVQVQTESPSPSLLKSLADKLTRSL
jgi:hypothetical protein